MTRSEIIADINETHRSLLRSERGHKRAHPHLDAEDDDYVFVEEALERWGDRAFRNTNWEC